jgi:hypothetical protein
VPTETGRNTHFAVIVITPFHKACCGVPGILGSFFKAKPTTLTQLYPFACAIDDVRGGIGARVNAIFDDQPDHGLAPTFRVIRSHAWHADIAGFGDRYCTGSDW